jgi:hypothetical protein
MLCPPHPILLDHSNYIWRRVQVMKPLIMQFSPTSYHIIPLHYIYSPQHPVLKHSICVPPLMFFIYVNEISLYGIVKMGTGRGIPFMIIT